ncbi:MAG: aldehyde dehydrogenase family protein [Terriglobia bacterium]
MSVRDADLRAVQQVRDLVERAAEAQRRWAAFSQAQIDAVIDSMAEAATREAEPLARLAVEETGYGVVADKVRKNKFCSEDVYRAIRPLPTVGILREDRESGVIEIAEPVGVVAAIIPSTNPTSTAIYKVLIALKARNAVVVSPHPSALRCICTTVELLTRAALKAGAPEGLIGCLTQVTTAATRELMRHPRVGVILATGGTGLVRAAYSSGKPAFGVGPGNVPAFIERTADVRKAVADIVTGTCFDHGTICSSEQAMVVEEPVREAALQELREQGAYFLNAAQMEALPKVLFRAGTLLVDPKVVGRSARLIAQKAGFTVPESTRVLVAELTGVGRDYPLSAEKLSPVLAFYTVRNWQEGIERCIQVLAFGGMGHTVAIHSQNESVVREFARRVPAFRVVVNSPAPHGSIGYSTRLFPAMTLGCGALGGNITSDNIGPQHLMNIKRVGYEMRPVEHITNPLHSREVQLPSAPPPAAAPPDRRTIARVVERFLAKKGVPGEKGTAANPGPMPSPPPVSRTEPVPKPRVADFVSERDVQDALERDEKICISPQSILTPLARDVGYAHNVFVEAEAPAAGRTRTPD